MHPYPVLHLFRNTYTRYVSTSNPVSTSNHNLPFGVVPHCRWPVHVKWRKHNNSNNNLGNEVFVVLIVRYKVFNFIYTLLFYESITGSVVL